eukprot:COSAG02_NODE_7343_length_3054_cov_1034.035533_5_plen_151_part_00
MARARPCGADTPPRASRAACACFCLCSQAEGSWSKERCCAVRGNTCDSGYCYDRISSSDYLYRLSPGEPERYETNHPGNTRGYQDVYASNWPSFGGVKQNGPFDLLIGDNNGPPGLHGHCNQGDTYRGSHNAACGGYHNWGHTDLEVWFI